MFERDILRDQVVLITGGGTGLGLSMARHIASYGARLFLIGRRVRPLQDAAAMIEQAGSECGYASCDVRDAAAVQSAVDAALDRHGRVTALINNAAGNILARTETLSSNAFAAVVDIVLKGTFHCTQAVARRWIAEEQPGNVVNIVTTYAETGSGFVVPSACAKAGVLAMTRSLAVEWARFRIRMNAIAPGPFPTEGAWSRLMLSQEMRDRLTRVHPMKRVGRHEELGDLVTYLLSPRSEYVNGACISIDGAMRWSGNSGFNHLADVPAEVWETMTAAGRGGQRE